MSNIQNPISLAPSGGFSKIFLQDKDQYMVSETENSFAPIQNTQPGTFKETKLIQESYVLELPNQYTLQFTPFNVLPSTTQIEIDYPSQITLTAAQQTKCIINTNQVFTDKCTIDTAQRRITITDAFS